MDSNNSGTSGVQIVTRRYLYDKMQVQNLPTINDKLNFLEDYLVDSYGDTSDNIKSLKERFSKFKHCFKERWSNSHRKEETFLKKYEEWLSGTFELPTKAENRPGRPSKSFEDSSERSKRRKTEELRTSFSDNFFNNLTKKLESNSDAIEFGLSVLHARIRIFESILHLAYKLPVKKYHKKRSNEEKELEAQTKRNIQERFRIETGLLIDMPKTNFGNTNDGNTSRRFFENPELAAEITNIDFNLIFRLKVILETISSGHMIDTKKFHEYAMETAKLYCDLYGWHPMTPTMHKILMHGAEIIENALLPIGQLSEEAAEARNKHFRLYRQNYARKFSRKQCNHDVYHRLLLSSDPLLSSMKQRRKNMKTSSFCKETVNMLVSAEPHTDTTDADENEDEY